MAKQIVVTCKECGRKLKTDERFVGRKGRCPGCGRAIRVTEEELQAAAAADSKPEVEAVRPAPEKVGGRKNALLTVEKIGDVALVRFTMSRVLDQSNVNQLAEELDELIDKYYLVKMVLNFEKIHYMSSAVLGKLINLKRNIEKEKGDLRLCGIDANIKEIFKIMRFDKLFKIYGTEEEAVKGLIR